MGMGISVARAISENGFVVTTTVGNSMYPMLRNRKDCVVIKKPERELEKYDVALYISGQRYVLHRVISVKEDVYVTRGDNCDHCEYIKKEQVIGVLESFTRKGKSYDCRRSRSYRIYSVVWTASAPFRTALRSLKLWLWKKIKKGSKNS